MNIYIPTENDIIHETSVDFVLRPCAKEIYIVQYDKSLPIIKVELYRNGERYVLPETGVVVNVRLGKLDKTFVYKSILGTNSERNAVYFEIDEQMATISGHVGPVIEVIEGSKVACSSPIHMIIEKNPVQNDQIESHDSFPIIYELQGTVADHEARITDLENQVTGEFVTLHTDQDNIDGKKGFLSDIYVDSTGSLSLFYEPTLDQHAVNKEYADRKLELHSFNGFVGGTQVHDQIQNGQTMYCQSGTQSEVDPSQSPIINIELTQEHISAVSNRKAIYIRKIHIEYESDDDPGTILQWDYEFTSRIFGSGGNQDDINPKVVTLTDSNTGVDLDWTLIYRPATGKQYYGSYNTTKGQQFGSNSNPADYISLYTTSLQNVTVKNVYIEVSGNSGTAAKTKITLVQDQWAEDTQGVIDPTITSSNAVYDFYHGDEGTHLGSGGGVIIEYNHVFLKKENGIVTTIDPYQTRLYIEEDATKLSDTYRLYKYVGTQMQEVSKTRLGTTSNTAYRGDYGQDNYNKLKEVREQNFEFTGRKEFHDHVLFDGERFGAAVTISGALYVDQISHLDGSPGLTWDSDYYVWDIDAIRYINAGQYGNGVRFLQTEYVNPVTGEIEVGGVDTNQVRLLNIADPINDMDAVNKRYVNNYLNIQNGTGTNAIQEKMADATVNFIGRNPNAEELDPTISTTINTGASGNQSTAFGKNTMALATASFTNGNKTLAKGEESHAEGYQSVALGDGSHAEGSRTTSYGSQSHSEGIETVAYGNDSHAEGEGTEARGINAHSEGYYTKAIGNSSHSEGSKGEAKGITSHAEGTNNYIGEKQSSQPSSGDETSSSTPSGYTVSAGESSHAEGFDNFIYGAGSHAEGAQNVINGTMSHAEGVKNTIDNTDGAHAEGYKTTVIGTYAHAEGQLTRAEGYASHAEGTSTRAVGTCSHAEGSTTTAYANFSHTMGTGTYAGNESMLAIGKYNSAISNTLFVVGNGTSESVRSNAFEVYEDGHAEVGLMGTTVNSVATKGYVDTKVAANTAITGATKCKITYDSKGLVTAGADLAASDIPDLSATYVTLNTDQTINSTKTIAKNQWLKFEQTTGTAYIRSLGSGPNYIGLSISYSPSGVTAGTASVVIRQSTVKMQISNTNGTSTKNFDFTLDDSNNRSLSLDKLTDGTNSISVAQIVAKYDKPSTGIPASDLADLDASKITSGTFADARIASASTWNAKYDKPSTGIPASDLQEKYIRTEIDSQIVYIGDIDFKIQYPSTGHGDDTKLRLTINGLERITFTDTYGNLDDSMSNSMGLGWDADGEKGGYIRLNYIKNNTRYDRYYCFEPGYEPEYGAKTVQYLLSNETVGKWQRTTSVVAGPLTNINGRTFQNYTATLKTSGYTYYHIQCNAGECSEEEAAIYMYYMTGSKFVPKYDYNYPKNSIIIFADGSMWKPQYDSSAAEKFCLFRLQDSYANTFVLRNTAITGATKCKITYDSKGLVTAGADLAASDIPNLDASKITSGTFADARIASASNWNAKTKMNINGSDRTTYTIYAPTTSGTSGQILQSNGSGQAPTWVNMPGNGYTLTFHIEPYYYDEEHAYYTYSITYYVTYANGSSTTKTVSGELIVNQGSLEDSVDFEEYNVLSIAIISITIKNSSGTVITPSATHIWGKRNMIFSWYGGQTSNSALQGFRSYSGDYSQVYTSFFLRNTGQDDVWDKRVVLIGNSDISFDFE